MLEDCDFSDLIQSVNQITRECYVGYVKWWMIQHDRIITVAPDSDPSCAENDGKSCWPDVYGCQGVDKCPNGHRR